MYILRMSTLYIGVAGLGVKPNVELENKDCIFILFFNHSLTLCFPLLKTHINMHQCSPAMESEAVLQGKDIHSYKSKATN